MTVVIVGTGYSGSTLLSLLLDHHPALCSIGELTGPKHMPDPSIYPCSCGALIDDCPLWRPVMADASDSGFPMSSSQWDLHFTLRPSRFDRVLTRTLGHNRLDRWRDRAVAALPMGARLGDVGARNSAVLAALRKNSGKPVVVDASKDPRRVPLLRLYAGETVRTIHLVRQAPAYVSSALGHGASLEGAIRAWNRMAAQALKLEGPVMRLHYEDLVVDPLGAVNRCAAFCDAAPMADLPRWEKTEHHVIGNRMRHVFDGSVRLDTRWRERLQPGQIADVERKTKVWTERLAG